MRKLMICLVVGITLGGCVGTDFIDDPLMTVPARVEISPNVTAVQVGETATFQAIYYDTLGNIVQGTVFAWISSDPAIASIDANGLASGRLPGQASIVATAASVSSDAALLTVVADPNQVASVTVTPDSGEVAIGGTLQFSAAAWNLNGNSISGKFYTWRTSDSNVVTIDNTGLATALIPGDVDIIATTDGIDSSPAILTVLGGSRSGTFTKRPGTSYNVGGTAILEEQSNGSLLLRFGSDFSSSNGPGLAVFLSGSNAVGSGSINVGTLKSRSGEQTYEVPSGVQLDTYDWVIIHCVPFNVTFGYAELQ